MTENVLCGQQVHVLQCSPPHEEIGLNSRFSTIGPNSSKNCQEQFQLYFHVSLVRRGTITNRSQPGILGTVWQPCWAVLEECVCLTLPLCCLATSFSIAGYKRKRAICSSRQVNSYATFNIKRKKTAWDSQISDHRPYRCLHYTCVTKATTDTFVLHSNGLRYQHHSEKWNRIRADWPRSARNGTVKQREPFGPIVEKQLFTHWLQRIWCQHVSPDKEVGIVWLRARVWL